MKKLFMAAVVLVMVSIPTAGFAGNIDSPGDPSAGSGMYTLLELYNYLNSGTVPTISGSFQEPSSGPGSTMKTTKNIYDDSKAKFDLCDAQASDVGSGKKFFSTLSGNWGVKTGTGSIATDPAPVAKTGQTTSYATGDDGDLEEGVAWPDPRWTCYDAEKVEVNCSTGSPVVVTDDLTGLMWAKNPSTWTGKSWANAITECNALDLGGYTDWRLPNTKELFSLIDCGQYNPALPPSHPFTGVELSTDYWSSSTYAAVTTWARAVTMYGGGVRNVIKTDTQYVWPVRSGN